MSYNWLVFANKSKCNHAKALQELGYISWRQDRVRFAIGDIVYLFMSDERCVRFKTIVTAANQERGDSAYWNGAAPKDKTFKLELLEEYTGDALSETKLFEHGFHGGRSLQHPMRNNPELFEYIEEQFNRVHASRFQDSPRSVVYTHWHLPDWLWQTTLQVPYLQDMNVCHFPVRPPKRCYS